MQSIKKDNLSNFKLDQKYKDIGQKMKFFVRTYGCQSNVRDGEIISGILIEMGFVLANEIEEADLVILNTCAVRDNAEKKIFGEIGFLKKNKYINPNFRLGVCGCMIQEESVVNKIVNQIPHVDFLFGTHNIHQVPEIIASVYNDDTRVIKVLSKEGQIVENLPSIRGSGIKAFVNIMYGCNKFCTYCIVPYTRGRIRSRSKEEILNEIQSLITKGYKEVTLLGQNVNSYNIDKPEENYYFVDLLKDVAKTNIPRVRFVTSNPWNFNLEIIDVMKENPNIMPYFHLPIQSGDEEILSKMNRKMLMNEYYDKIDYIRKQLPHSGISTDIIVGFPNETKEQFDNTLKMYQRIKFDNAFTFIYSPREGTKAAVMEDIIPLKEKQQRLSELNELVKLYAKENNERMVGRIVDVLVEGESKTKKHILMGYCPEWKTINFVGDAKIGNIVKVKITSASRFSLTGEQVK